METINFQKHHKKLGLILLIAVGILFIFIIPGIIILIAKIRVFSESIDILLFCCIVLLSIIGIIINVSIESKEEKIVQNFIMERLDIKHLNKKSFFKGKSFSCNLYYSEFKKQFCKPETEYSLRSHELSVLFFSISDIKKIEPRVIPHNFLKPVQTEINPDGKNSLKLKYTLGGAMIGGVGGAVFGAVIDGLSQKDEIPRKVISGIKITLNNDTVIECLNYDDKIASSEIKKALPEYLTEVVDFVNWVNDELKS